MSQLTVIPLPGLPTDWSRLISIKPPAKDEKLGYVDMLTRGSTFKFLSASDKPLAIKSVRTPYECFTVPECVGKGRGKLTTRIQINKPIWESLSKLDAFFKSFLITHRAKLFSQADADYIGRDNSAIALKYKNLAPCTPEGEPQYDAFITVRINGRVGEIADLVVKDGSNGRYVAGVEWVGRTSPLPQGATCFQLVDGYANSAGVLTPIIRSTLPVKGIVPVGAQRVRYVGPGEIRPETTVMRYLTLRPAYWALAPGGGASLALVADTIVLEYQNEDAEAPAASSAAAPEGFALYDDLAFDDAGAAMTSVSNAKASDPSPMPAHEHKRSRTGGTANKPMTDADEEVAEFHRRIAAMDEAAAEEETEAQKAFLVTVKADLERARAAQQMTMDKMTSAAAAAPRKAPAFFSRSASLAAGAGQGAGGSAAEEQRAFQNRMERAAVMDRAELQRTSKIGPEAPFEFDE
jgi:hypothetical protein